MLTPARKTILAFTSVLLCVTVFWSIGKKTPVDSIRPVTELPETRHIAPEEWIGISSRGGLAGTGWVLLPATSTEPPFHADVDPATRGFLAPQVCGECHQEIYQSFLLTTHATTSAEPGPETILGSFKDDQNILKTGNPNLWFRMTADDGKYCQELHVRKDSSEYVHRRPIDLVLGSGNHGQAYLYWEGDRLYQMHVSYLTELKHWVNSPGMYIDGTADFARPVPGRCLDCHATWFAEDRKAINRFDRHNYVLGVTCVRCHGPGHEHVNWHRQMPGKTEGKRILNPSTLSRERLNELCAQCHSAGEPNAPAFAYRPGEPLSEYLQLDLSADDPGNEDPHSANQLARLMKSKCYSMSDSLSCISCHDPHRDQRKHPEEFSRSCLKCHTVETCGERQTLGSAIETRCIDCHMPARRDLQVRVEMGQGSVSALIRDHQIGRWPEVSERIRNQILNSSQVP